MDHSMLLKIHTYIAFSLLHTVVHLVLLNDGFVIILKLCFLLLGSFRKSSDPLFDIFLSTANTP